MPSYSFGPGDLAVLLDNEGNHHTVRIAEGKTVHTHLGTVPHADLIGLEEGAAVRTRRGSSFIIARPRLADFVLNGMERQSGIVYPKDAAQIIMWADVGPGMRVLEAGLGSGGLTMSLLRAVGETGTVIGYELRADFIDLTMRNVSSLMSNSPRQLMIREHSIYDGIVDDDLDRVILDLPEPWQVLPQLVGHLKLGGWLCAYVPSILQASQLVEAMRETRSFLQTEVQEVLVRPWHLRGAAIRPAQQMVGHTGFITVGRLVAPGGGEIPVAEQDLEGNRRRSNRRKPRARDRNLASQTADDRTDEEESALDDFLQANAEPDSES